MAQQKAPPPLLSPLARPRPVSVRSATSAPTRFRRSGSCTTWPRASPRTTRGVSWPRTRPAKRRPSSATTTPWLCSSLGTEPKAGSRLNPQVGELPWPSPKTSPTQAPPPSPTSARRRATAFSGCPRLPNLPSATKARPVSAGPHPRSPARQRVSAGADTTRTPGLTGPAKGPHGPGTSQSRN